MQRLLTAAQMREAEQYTINGIGIPSLVLMERAALGVCEVIRTLYPDCEGSNVFLLCGYGNNGADGLALARMLLDLGYPVCVFMVGAFEKISEECCRQLKIAEKLGIRIRHFQPEAALDEMFLDELAARIRECRVLVDGLFGIGLNRGLSKEWIGFLEACGRYREESACSVVAIDVPSGLDSTTGQIRGAVLMADVTVTFGWAKTGQILREGLRCCGRRIVRQAGISMPLEEERKGQVYLLDEAQAAFMQRPEDGNKTTFGKVLCLCGSEEMGGAALLASRSALKSGAGMVKVVTLCSCLCSDELQKKLLLETPEIMYHKIVGTGELQQEIDWCDFILAGCGLSDSEDAEKLLLDLLHKAQKPVVLDADALNMVSRHMDVLTKRREQGLVTICTPHPGEFRRMFGTRSDRIAEDKLWQDLAFCKEAAREYGIILVAKDAVTLITDGEDAYIVAGWNSGMASAGSGDVLAGCVAGLNAPKYNRDHLLTTAMAVLCHAQCGRMAAGQYGKFSMSASNLIEMLPMVLK